MSIGRSFVVGLRQEVVVNAQFPNLGSATSRFVAKKVSKAGIGMRKVHCLLLHALITMLP
jgi:hypothetical protein